VSAERRVETRQYVLGFGVALLLTGAAFAAVYWQKFAALPTLGIVFALGLTQVIVHIRFFLHVGFKKSAREDLQLILFSALIIALMVSGTLVLLLNLRGRML